MRLHPHPRFHLGVEGTAPDVVRSERLAVGCRPQLVGGSAQAWWVVVGRLAGGFGIEGCFGGNPGCPTHPQRHLHRHQLPHLRTSPQLPHEPRRHHVPRLQPERRPRRDLPAHRRPRQLGWRQQQETERQHPERPPGLGLFALVGGSLECPASVLAKWRSQEQRRLTLRRYSIARSEL